MHWWYELELGRLHESCQLLYPAKQFSEARRLVKEDPAPEGPGEYGQDCRAERSASQRSDLGTAHQAIPSTEGSSRAGSHRPQSLHTCQSLLAGKPSESDGR